MQVAETIQDVRRAVADARGGGLSVGLVPTMGALHEGHISLVKAAKRRCDFVVLSIFVNPTQFGPGEDFEKYPRPIEDDLRICEREGVDVVFAPTAGEMYPRGIVTWVEVEKLTDNLCGASRPGHFRGVTTVCSKLFNIVTPDFAFFGQKDAQQSLVVRRMAADLDMPLEIVVCPTVREADGLAMSSRNKYLSDAERKDAPLIFQSLEEARRMTESGETDPGAVKAKMLEIMGRSSLMKPEYVSIVDTELVADVTRIAGRVLVAVAVRLGQARLIDNVIIDTDR